jgi:hypothetical protein
VTASCWASWSSPAGPRSRRPRWTRSWSAWSRASWNWRPISSRCCALHQVTQGLLKIDEVLSKYGEALIKGELTDQKIKLAQAELDRAFDKLGDIKVGGDALKEAIGDIKLDTASLLSTLDQIAPVGDLSHKDELQYLKIVDAFGDLDEGLLKLQESILARKAGKGQQEYLIIKMNDVLITSRLVEDSELKQHLLSIAAETEKVLIGLLQPPKTDDVIT